MSTNHGPFLCRVPTPCSHLLVKVHSDLLTTLGLYCAPWLEDWQWCNHRFSARRWCVLIVELVLHPGAS